MAREERQLREELRESYGGALSDLNTSAADILTNLEDSTDSMSSAGVTIDLSHHEIHDGKHFVAWFSGTAKGDGDKLNIYLKAPNTTTRIHMFAQFSSSGAAYSRIRQAPTVTSDTGTNGVAIYNNDCNSANASTVYDNAASPAVNKVGNNVTVTAPGTVKYQDYAGTAKQIGTTARVDSEFILKQNTAYVFESESDAAGLALNIILKWYEV